MDETIDPIRSNIAKNQVRDSSDKFVSKEDPTKLPPISVNVKPIEKVNTTNPPDLLNVKVTNPLVYIKYWWKKLMANEGIDFRKKNYGRLYQLLALHLSQHLFHKKPQFLFSDIF